jgi:hypothetical protein
MYGSPPVMRGVPVYGVPDGMDPGFRVSEPSEPLPSPEDMRRIAMDRLPGAVLADLLERVQRLERRIVELEERTAELEDD